MTPDVNVLLSASRDDHVDHRAARHWLEGAMVAAERGTRLDMLPMVATGFLRVATHPKVFPDPMPAGVAWKFLDSLLASPGVRMVALGAEWAPFQRLCQAKALTGNAIPDAWIAAAVKAAGLHLITFDRGFSRLLDSSDYTLLRP